MDFDIDWFGPHFSGKELIFLKETIESGFINDGPQTRKLEKEIVDIVGSKFAVAVTSGTSAIALSLFAIGITPGDEVLVPNFTFAATANAVKLAGGIPKFVDIDEATLCISETSLLESVTSRTRAVVTVDVNGRSPHYKIIEDICKTKNIPLITDSAEALGSKYNGKPCGSFGVAGCFSFSANKTISSGQGGMIVTSDKEIYRRWLQLKNQGRLGNGTGGADVHHSVGFNFKYTDLQASVALSQLTSFEDRLAQANERDEIYRHYLNDIDEVNFIAPKTHHGECLQWFDVFSPQRDRIINHLTLKGISSRAFWHPLNLQPSFENNQKFNVSEKISKEGFWLPSRFDLSENDIKAVVLEMKRSLVF